MLRGWYNCLTLAIYGSVDRVISHDRDSPPPPPPPPPPPQPQTTLKRNPKHGEKFSLLSLVKLFCSSQKSRCKGLCYLSSHLYEISHVFVSLLFLSVRFDLYFLFLCFSEELASLLACFSDRVLVYSDDWFRTHRNLPAWLLKLKVCATTPGPGEHFIWSQGWLTPSLPPCFLSFLPVFLIGPV